MRADRGAGLAKGEGGMVILGDSGREVRAVLPVLLFDAPLSFEEVVAAEALDSYDVLRDNAGCEVGGLIEGRAESGAEGGSIDFSLKLNRLLVLVDIGLRQAGDMFLRKSR